MQRLGASPLTMASPRHGGQTPSAFSMSNSQNGRGSMRGGQTPSQNGLGFFLKISCVLLKL